nr:hypothetical protein [uncultured Anaerostipes sp.]
MSKIKQKGSKKIIVRILLIICFIYCFMTPKGSVRFWVFISGYPKEAITGKLIYEKDTKGELKSTEKAYIIEKPPIEEATQGILDRWVAKRYILFYAANYESGV